MMVYREESDSTEELITSEREILELDELLERNLITTQTCMFRNNNIPFPAGFENPENG